MTPLLEIFSCQDRLHIYVCISQRDIIFRLSIVFGWLSSVSSIGHTCTSSDFAWNNRMKTCSQRGCVEVVCGCVVGVAVRFLETGTISIEKRPPSLVQIMACRLVGAKTLSEPMLEYSSFEPWQQTSVKSLAKFVHFHSRKCIWKCRLGSGKFVSASIC